VDYLVNNAAGMTVLPIEVKSGKDFTSHKALDKFLADKEYNIPAGIVLDNEREVYTKDNVTYMPIYYIMCIERAEIPEGDGKIHVGKEVVEGLCKVQILS
jgi:hypothetical protein